MAIDTRHAAHAAPLADEASRTPESARALRDLFALLDRIRGCEHTGVEFSMSSQRCMRCGAIQFDDQQWESAVYIDQIGVAAQRAAAHWVGLVERASRVESTIREFGTSLGVAAQLSGADRATFCVDSSVIQQLASQALAAVELATTLVRGMGGGA